MAISLQGDVASRLSGGMQVGSAIELPYFAPKFWAVNGDARLASLGGALFFGGWAVDALDWEKALAEDWVLEENEMPQGFAKSVIVTADGRNVDAYVSRSIVVAPICTRVMWVLADGTRLPAYTQGARQHVQAIVYLGHKRADREEIIPLGPVMLSCKGYQAKNLLDSFSAWDRATKGVRSKIAPGIPAWCFYLAIGTFGNDRKQEMVGKNSQSPITPIRAWVPKDMNEDLIEKVFVGQDVAESMAFYLEASQEWLHAYDRRTEPAANGNGNGHSQTDFAKAIPGVGPEDFPLDPVAPPGDEYPF
jgi:hypothetical protein